MKSVYDKDFKYTPAAKTSAEYLRERFAEIRAEIEERQKAAAEKVVGTIKPIVRAKVA